MVVKLKGDSESLISERPDGVKIYRKTFDRDDLPDKSMSREFGDSDGGAFVEMGLGPVLVRPAKEEETSVERKKREA